MKKILVDTSIWIEYFKGNTEVINLIHSTDRYSAYIAGPIITELIQGFKTSREKERFITSISALPKLLITDEDWIEAGTLGNTLKEKGKTIPIPDLLIFQLAHKNNCSLYTLDKHFQIIVGATGFELEIIQ